MHDSFFFREFLKECFDIFKNVSERFKHTHEEANAKVWLEKNFVSLKILQFLLEASKIRKDKEITEQAQQLSNEIYDFLQVRFTHHFKTNVPLQILIGCKVSCWKQKCAYKRISSISTSGKTKM
jgi:hypothetical protein